MTPVLVSAVVYSVIAALCYWKPNAGRIFFGIFFLIMAYGVNVTILVIDPNLFTGLGDQSALPLYRTIFTEIIGANPVFWGLVAVVFETATGLLLMSKGTLFKVGAVMGILFALGSTPFGTDTLANPILALPLQYLLSKEFTYSLTDQLRLRWAHR